MVRLPDDSVRFEGEDDRTAVLRVNDLLEFDRFQIFGPGNVRTHLTLETTYRRGRGAPTIIAPTSSDPLSPFNWAGTIWEGTAKGAFFARYADGSRWFKGTLDSALASLEGGRPGHIGHERNGVFLHGEPDGSPRALTHTATSSRESRRAYVSAQFRQ